MYIGMSTSVWVSPFSTASFDVLRDAIDIAYNVIEVAVEVREVTDWRALKKVSRELGLRVTVSGAFGMDRDISSERPELRANGLSYIIDCLEIANDFESPVFGRPLYSAVGKTRLVSAEQKAQERQWCLEILYLAIRRA